MAYIEKRGPSKYRVRYRAPDGREKSKTFAKKAYAERFMHTVEESKLRGAWVDPALGKIRFDDWADKWFETRTDLRPSTRARDESYLNNHVLPYWKDYKIGDITSSDVRDWVALLKKKRKPATVRLIFALLPKPMKEAEHDRNIACPPL